MSHSHSWVTSRGRASRSAWLRRAAEELFDQISSRYRRLSASARSCAGRPCRRSRRAAARCPVPQRSRLFLTRQAAVFRASVGRSRTSALSFFPSASQRCCFACRVGAPVAAAHTAFGGTALSLEPNTMTSMTDSTPRISTSAPLAPRLPMTPFRTGGGAGRGGVVTNRAPNRSLGSRTTALWLGHPGHHGARVPEVGGPGPLPPTVRAAPPLRRLTASLLAPRGSRVVFRAPIRRGA